MPKSFVRDQRGNVAIMLGLTAPVLIGMIGAAVDYSRLASRHAELQRIADAAALGLFSLKLLENPRHFRNLRGVACLFKIQAVGALR